MPDTPATTHPAPLKCVVLVPIGPGHEALAREAQASVEFAFNQNPGPFSELIVLTLDDTQGKHGRSQRRNDGIAWAQANGYDWIFFLDADDLMAANAFADVSEYIADNDAIFGLIVEQSGAGDPRLRAGQIGATSDLLDILRNDPFHTLQMGHFVRTQCAAAIGFDSTMDTGEDFKYYLELWRRFRCRKIERVLFVNRRGRHSAGPRSADGEKWRRAVSAVFAEFCAPLGLETQFQHSGKPVRFAIGNPMTQVWHVREQFQDAAELDYLRTIVAPGSTIVDIGSDVGNHVVYCGLYLQPARIIAVDARPAARALLQRNVELNGLVDVVEQTPVIASNSKVQFIRIGLSEGLRGLRGAADLIHRDQPQIFLSVPESDAAELLNWVAAKKYRVRRVFSHPRTRNYLLAPAERIDGSARTSARLQIVSFKWNPLPGQERSIPSQTRERGAVKSPYNAWHVNNMFRQLQRHLTIPFDYVVVTDDAAGIDPDIRVVPLWDKCRSLGGCYNRLYVFSRDMSEIIGPRFACLDLDTVLVDNCDHIFSREEDFVYYRWEAPGEAAIFNCGLYIMDAGARDFVWTDFIADPAKARNDSSAYVGTDQSWCNYRLPLQREACVSRLDGILDFRVELMVPRRRTLPGGAAMLTFPGPRDPGDADLLRAYPWLATHFLIEKNGGSLPAMAGSR